MNQIAYFDEPPPSDPLVDADVEWSVLGAALAYPDKIDLLGAVADKDFADSERGRVWRLITAQRSAGRAVSAVSVGSAYRSIRLAAGLEDVNVIDDLADLAATAPEHDAAIRAAGEALRSLSLRRRIAEVHERALADLRDAPPDETPSQMIGRAIDALGRLDEAGPSDDGRLGPSIEAAVARASNPEAAAQGAVFTGLTELDARMGGMRPGEFVVVAARPGMGKSLLANRLMRTVCEAGLGVMTFQLEMSREEVAARLMCDVARDQGAEIWYSSIRKGRVLRRDMDVLASAGVDVEMWPLIVDDRAGLKLDDMMQRARVARRQLETRGVRLGLVLVDHIGLIAPSVDRRGNKVAEMTDVSNAMKRMAKELGCPVVGLSQLNRGVESREDKRPLLADLRESGAIEQDADAVLLLYREAYYLKNRQATMDPASFAIEMASCKHRLEINVAKLRAGDAGLDIVDIDAATGSIRDKGTF